MIQSIQKEFDIIVQIAKRAEALYASLDRAIPDRFALLMDLEHVHAHIPMKLDALLKANDANFAHDVFGIRQHLNRATGKLENCFVPRYAQGCDAKAE
jgi:hypothetical protein